MASLASSSRCRSDTSSRISLEVARAVNRVWSTRRRAARGSNQTSVIGPMMLIIGTPIGFGREGPRTAAEIERLLGEVEDSPRGSLQVPGMEVVVRSRR